MDLDALEARKSELELRVSAIERDNDVAGAGDGARARAVGQGASASRRCWRSADPNDPLVQEMREKTRLLRGTLLWDFNASYKARLWKARKELRELNVAYKEARRRWVLVERAREDYPARTEAIRPARRRLQPRIAG